MKSEKELTKIKTLETLLKIETGDIRQLRFFEEKLVAVIAVCWALFQLSLAVVIMNSTIERTIHLAFAITLLFLLNPCIKRPLKRFKFLGAVDRIPVIDYIFAILGAGAALYLAIDYVEIGMRAGRPIVRDLIFATTLVVLLLEATRRIIGPALPVIAILFTGYAFLGPYMPDIMAFKGVSLSKYMSNISLSTEGIYGIPLGVSSSIVFLFVLLGALLEKAGAGRFFTNLALSFLGKYKGGAAKAAVVASGATGLVSGSSIANIVTTGPFTIPLMKKIGYPPKKAAATEVASSTDGQLMPPIMGAAAFIIAEYVNVPYIEVVKAAAIPAFVSYFGLFCITHLEASKLGIKGLPPEDIPNFMRTLKNGLHYMVPLCVLLVELIYFRHTPHLAAFRSILTLFAVIFYQEIRAALREDYTDIFSAKSKGEKQIMKETEAGKDIDAATHAIAVKQYRPSSLQASILRGFANGVSIILQGMIQGSKNMMSVALACGAAGIIVGVVNMGIGGMISGVVETLAQGNIFLLLFITALASMMIGMGLPTTATYIVMASLTAPIIVEVGALYDYVIPIMSAHLFCFYFGILADDTPPVGLAAYAASAIAESEPIPTGIQGFLYDIRTSVIAFMFVFNPDLILHGITSWSEALLIFGMALIGMSSFECFAQHYCLCRNKWYEIPLFLTGSFILFHPGALASKLGIPLEYKYYLFPLGILIYMTVIGIQTLRMKVAATKDKKIIKNVVSDLEKW